MALNITASSDQFSKQVTRSFVGFLIGLVVILGAGLWAIQAFGAPAKAAPSDEFVITWKTDNPGSSNSTSVIVPAGSSGFNYEIDWNNDGVFEQTAITSSVEHDFGEAGEYTIRIRGAYPYFRANSTGDAQKLVRVDQWGSNPWQTMERAFAEARNLTIAATDTPDVSNVTDMSSMFLNAESIASPDFSEWDVSSVTNMDSMFYNASSFNGDVSEWNVGSVENMNSLFGYASSFNGDVSGWDVSNVTAMPSLFLGASAFNGDVSGWDVSNVADMTNLFAFATSFNGNLSNWNTASLVRAVRAFEANQEVRTDFTNWDLSNVIDLELLTFQTPVPNDLYGKLLVKLAQDTTFENVLLLTDSVRCDQAAIDAYAALAARSWTLTDNGSCADIEVHSAYPGQVYVGTDEVELSITGSGFRPGAKVFVGDQELVVEPSSSTTSIGATFPATHITEPSFIDITVVNPGGFEFTLENAVQFIPAPAINSVSSRVEAGRKLLVITGVAMPPLTGAFPEVEGNFVPLCAVGYFDMSAEQLAPLLGLPPQYVSDTPFCMMAFENNAVLQNISTEVKIWVPNDFDVFAPGTITYGSLSFDYDLEDDGSTPEPEPEPIAPTIGVIGGDITETPVIAARPTFSGKAEPGSTVVVTVFSDPITCTTTADSNGDWSCTLPADLPAGNHTVYVLMTTPDGVETELGPFSVVVDGVNPTVLAPNTGFVGNTLAVVNAGQQINEKYPVVTWMVLGAALTLTGGMLVRNFATARSKK